MGTEVSRRCYFFQRTLERGWLCEPEFEKQEQVKEMVGLSGEEGISCVSVRKGKLNCVHITKEPDSMFFSGGFFSALCVVTAALISSGFILPPCLGHVFVCFFLSFFFFFFVTFGYQ